MPCLSKLRAKSSWARLAKTKNKIESRNLCVHALGAWHNNSHRQPALHAAGRLKTFARRFEGIHRSVNCAKGPYQNGFTFPELTNLMTIPRMTKRNRMSDNSGAGEGLPTSGMQNMSPL